jgi:hypothetical protein
MDYKCETCPVTKGVYIKYDKFCEDLEPELLGKIVFNPDGENNVIVNYEAGAYNFRDFEDDYCYEIHTSGYELEKKMCRNYKEGICILTGCDILNMVRPCSCKEKEII